MPPPTRRNRRKHRLRVPCSECHCPDNYPAKPKNHPSKHNRTPHPLVRSKSAVIRSLYKKIRTPFTRSQTVDESVLRHCSPQTSEYTVCESYILKPEQLGHNARKRIPEIYVEDCLEVGFNDRLVNKFRNDILSPRNCATGAHRRSRSWQDRSTRSKRPKQHGDFFPCSGWRRRDVDHCWTGSPYRGTLGCAPTKARSFDDDVIYGVDGSNNLIFRKAKSFEHETVSDNIFSDDSIRTAREKLKKNLSLSDARYGHRIHALKDQSKSYYDSNGEAESEMIRNIAKDQFRRIYLSSPERERIFYSYDHHRRRASSQEEAIFLPGCACRYADLDLKRSKYRRFESPIKRSISAFDIERELHGYASDQSSSVVDARHYLDEDPYNSQDSDHLYCSIDELLSPVDSYGYYSSLPGRGKWRPSSWERGLDIYAETSSRLPRRRARSTDSYLGDVFYDDYPYYDNKTFEGSYFESPPSTRTKRRRTFGSDDLPHYFSPDEYSDMFDDSPVPLTEELFESSSPRRRRKGGTYDHHYYENVPMTMGVDAYQPEIATTRIPPIYRASSTPVLYSDGESPDLDRSRRLLQRHRRNRSCPETRDLPYYYDDRPPPEVPANFFLDSDEDFGSVETVIDRNYLEARAEERDLTDGARAYRRKNSCPECRELDTPREGRRRSRSRRDHDDPYQDGASRRRHRRRNSSCPEAREIGHYDDREHHHHQPSSKRNVAISDTLEYYEYSMESESQCSENCGFGPSNPRRPRNRAPCPSNANSNIFDSQTATSDTAKNPRATVEHDNPSSRTHAKTQRLPKSPTSPDERHPRTLSDDAERRRDGGINRRSSSVPESSHYPGQSSSYEKTGRHELAGAERNGHSKRGQFSRSFSNTEAPADDKVGKSGIRLVFGWGCALLFSAKTLSERGGVTCRHVGLNLAFWQGFL